MLVIYLSSLIRSVIALHNLINNKVMSFILCLLILLILELIMYVFVVRLVMVPYS